MTLWYPLGTEAGKSAVMVDPTPDNRGGRSKDARHRRSWRESQWRSQARASIDRRCPDAVADLIKFQTFSADRLVTSLASKADYQGETTDAGESQHAMLRRLALTRDMHEALIAHCKARRIQFFSTGFDAQSIDLLVELGVSSLKMTSGEITNLPYLRHVGRFGKPVILSTGMATLGEIEAALESPGLSAKSATRGSDPPCA